MIKTTAKFSKHFMIEILRNAVIIFVLMVVTLLIGLKIGISADKLTVGPYKVSGLYIKLDKRLVLTAHDIFIPQSKGDPSFSSLDKTFDGLKKLLRLFEFVAIHDIHYKNNKIDFVYADNLLHINTNDYEIAGRIERKEKRFIADVPMLYLKKHKISLIGQFTYSYHVDRLHTWGTFDMYGIQGKFVASKVKDEILFDLQSKLFDDLKPIADILPIKESIKVWPADRVKAKQYKLLSLKGEGSIRNDTFKLDVETLKGELELRDVKIRFKDEVAPVLAKQVNMQYRNGGLFFTLNKPTYKSRNLEGSSLSIIDLTGKKATSLILDLIVDSSYDSEIQKILQAYKLNIPVLQKSGTAKGKVHLDVRLKDGSTTAVIDIDINNALVHVYKIELPIENGNIHYENGTVSLNDVNLKEKLYSGLLAGEIDLKKEQAKLMMDFDNVLIQKEKEKIFELKNKKVDIALDYSDGVKVAISQLAFSLYEKENKLEIKLDDLSKVKPYINHKGFIQEGGKIKITTDDLKSFNFNGLMHRSSCFFYDRDDICHTRVPISGLVTAKGIDFYAFDNRLHFNQEKSLAELNNINIDLEKIISYNDNLKQDANKTKVLDKAIVVVGKKSDIRYKNFILKTDSYDIEIKSNGDLNAIGSSEGDIVKFEKKGKNISINALRIKDRTLHPLINFSGLKGGRYSIKQFGDIDKTMEGRVIIEGGVMKDFKAYNNTVALLNTLPSLVVLQDPGFSEQGFKIKEGVAEYRMISDKKIIFDSIFIKGGSSSVVGKGYIDLVKQTIDLKLAVQTAKDFGKVVGNIPLLGYILLGKDKSMTIGLRIRGDLNKPEVKTSAAKDILALPLNLIKRTLESPVEMQKKSKQIQKKNPIQKEEEPTIHEQLGLDKPTPKKKKLKKVKPMKEEPDLF